MGGVKRLYEKELERQDAAARSTEKAIAVPDYKKAKLGTRFRALVKVRQEIKEEIEKLEAKLGDTDNPGINQEIELALAEHDLRTVRCEDWTVTLCEGKNVNLSKTRLIEEGVDVEVIEACTKVTPYTYIQVTETKKSAERAEAAVAAGADLGKIKKVTLKKSVKNRVLRKAAKAERATGATEKAGKVAARR